LSKDWYGGVYVEDNTFHILALKETYSLLVKKVDEEYIGQEIALVVDDPETAKIYSLNELYAAADILRPAWDELGIVGMSTIHLNRDNKPVTNGLGVDIDKKIPLTEELKEKILNMVEVKNIDFSSADGDNPNT
jgi:hypothetical protein